MTCFECDRPAHHRHHVVPRLRGGTKTVPLCVDCHAKAHHRDKAMGVPALTSAALQAKRARGESTGNCPYGYRSEGGVLRTNPAEVALIDAVVAARARGLSMRGIAAELAGAGYTTRGGGPVNAMFVHRVLKGAKKAAP